MPNFGDTTYLHIPEGEVQSISIGGSVVWSSVGGVEVEAEIIVNSAVVDGAMYLSGKVTIDGVEYGNASSGATLNLPVGTVIYCQIGANGAGNIATVTVNGSVVSQVTGVDTGAKTAVYEYVATSNVTIELTGWIGTLTSFYSSVIITEK